MDKPDDNSKNQKAVSNDTESDDEQFEIQFDFAEDEADEAADESVDEDSSVASETAAFEEHQEEASASDMSPEAETELEPSALEAGQEPVEPEAESASDMADSPSVAAADDQDETTVEAAPPQLVHDQFEEIFEGELMDLQAPQVPSEDTATESTPQSLDQPLDFTEKLTLEGQIEAILFASPKPLKAHDLYELLQDEPEHEELQSKDVDQVLQSLVRSYEEHGGGFRLESIRGAGYQFRTAPAAAPLMEKLFATKPRPLSRAALETLSIIAYRQPATRADVEFVRGVDAGSIIKNLLDRQLIACVGRKEDAGRPMLFGTTDEFLKVFRLESLDDLPSLASFQPSAETVNQALETMENRSEEVDVETFIGDEDQQKPNISEGLVEGEEADTAVLEAGEESAADDPGDEPGQDRVDAVDNHASEQAGVVRKAEAIEDRQDDSSTVERSGATAADESFDASLPQGSIASDGQETSPDEDTEISFPDGSELPSRSGAVDRGGSDRD